VELFRATLFNLKTEPIEDRERRNQESNRIFLRRCWEPDEIDLIDEQAGDLLPEETNTEIKSEPIDEIEEDTSLLSMETEPLDYLPESYSESMENSSHIDTINLRANEMESNGIYLQQRGESEEEINEIDDLPTENSSHIDTTNPRANEFESNRMFLQQHRDSEEEMNEIDNNIPLVVPPVLPVPLEPEEINETNTQLVVPEALVLSNTLTETSSPIDTTTNHRANDLDNGITNSEFKI